ncbi:hypothetical protein Tco_0551658 [Tanacetum coccineum]
MCPVKPGLEDLPYGGSDAMMSLGEAYQSVDSAYTFGIHTKSQALVNLDVPRENGVRKFSEQCIGKASHAQTRRKMGILGTIHTYTTESGPSTALKMTVPSTTEEKICKKNDVKARSLLLMALWNG